MAKRGNGEGTIYYSEKLNKWVGQYSAGRKPDGSLNRKSVYGNTRKEVKEKIVTKLSEYQKGIVINKSDIKVYQLGLELLETKFKTNKIKETSYGTISHSLNKIKDTELGNTPIQKVTYKTIQDFLNTNIKMYKGVKNDAIKTVSAEHVHGKDGLGYCVFPKSKRKYEVL